MTDEEFEKKFVSPYMQNCIKYSKDGSLHMHFIDWRGLRIFLNVGNKLYDELKNICVWSKTNGGGMGSLYRSRHEMVCIFKIGKAAHINNIELGKNGRNRTNIWEYPGVRANTPDSLELLKLHPTSKPVALLYSKFALKCFCWAYLPNRRTRFNGFYYALKTFMRRYNKLSTHKLR